MTDIKAGDGVTLTTDTPDRQINLLEDPTSTEVIGRLPAGTQVLVLATATGGEAPYHVGGFDETGEYSQGWVSGDVLHKREWPGIQALLMENFTTAELHALSQALDARRRATLVGMAFVLTPAQSAALEKFTRLSGQLSDEPAGNLSLMNLSA
jgi:hypothetical protein